jgi:hypothetical protein
MDFHPDYPDIPVLRAENNEHPHPGAFYYPRYGETLEYIAEVAYSMMNVAASGQSYGLSTLGAQKINASEYNAMNNVYRTNPSCNSMVIPSTEYQSTGTIRGQISICNPLPTIWIPPLADIHAGKWEEPWNVDPYRIYVPQETLGRQFTSDLPPREPVEPVTWGYEEQTYTGDEYMEAIPPDWGDYEEPLPEEDKTKTYIIIGVVAAAAVVGGVLLLRR